MNSNKNRGSTPQHSERLAASSQSLLLQHFAEKGIFSKMHMLPKNGPMKKQPKVSQSKRAATGRQSVQKLPKDGISSTNMHPQVNNLVKESSNKSSKKAISQSFVGNQQKHQEHSSINSQEQVEKINGKETAQANLSFSNHYSFIESSSVPQLEVSLQQQSNQNSRQNFHNNDMMKILQQQSDDQYFQQMKVSTPSLLFSQQQLQNQKPPQINRPQSSLNKAVQPIIISSSTASNDHYYHINNQPEQNSYANLVGQQLKAQNNAGQQQKTVTLDKAKKFRDNYLIDQLQKQNQKINQIPPVHSQSFINQSSNENLFNVDQNIQMALNELSPSKVPKSIMQNLQFQISNNIVFSKAKNGRSRSPKITQSTQDMHYSQREGFPINKQEFMLDPHMSLQIDSAQNLQSWLQSNTSLDQKDLRRGNLKGSNIVNQKIRSSHSPINSNNQKIVKELEKENEKLQDQCKHLQSQLKVLKNKTQTQSKEIANLREENESIKKTSSEQIQRFENVIKRFQIIDDEYQRERQENEQIKFELQEKQVQQEMSIAHIQSLVSVMSDTLEYVVTRCQIGQPGPSVSHSRNQSQSQHNFEQTQLSNSTDFMDRSYDDERRNLIEQIKSLLIAKIDAIHKTIQGIDLQRELNSIRNWKIVEPPQLQMALNSYDTNHNSVNSRKETQGNMFTQQQLYSRNTFVSNNTVNFLGMGGSLYNGTLGAQSNSSNQVESDSTPIPSFGRISARDEKSSNRTSEQNKSMNKALTFSESKFNIEKGLKKKSLKTQNKEILNNDSMMNINPFVPSDIHSKISYDNFKSHSSMSKDGQEIVFTMKESLRDLDTFNLSPEKTPIIIHQTFSQSFSPTLEAKRSKKAYHDNNQFASLNVQEFDYEDQYFEGKEFDEPDSFIKKLPKNNLNTLRNSKNIHSQDNLQGSFGPAETGSHYLGFSPDLLIGGLQSHKSQEVQKQNFHKYSEGYKFNESSISMISQSVNDDSSNNILSNNIKSAQLYPPSSGKETAIAKFQFTAQKDKDLSFNVGDEITIEKKRNNGWWVGHFNGKRGYFPHNYVEIVGSFHLENSQVKNKSEGGLGFNSSFNEA